MAKVSLALSAEALALASTPSGIERFRIENRAEWLAKREMDVTASVVGAVFREHEYVSEFDLWQQKTGAATASSEENAAMRRGRLLEPVAFQLLAEERPSWRISPLDNRLYYRDPAARIGCTPDGFAVDPDRQGFGICQVKTTDSLTFRRKWRPEKFGEEINVPTWIGLQAMTEMRLTGASWAVVALLVVGHGLDIHVVDVAEPDGLWEITKLRVADFWRSVDLKQMPDPDFEKDARRIVEHYAIKTGQTVDLSGDNRLLELVDEREKLKQIESAGSAAEKPRKAIEAEIIAKMGTANHARLADGRTITVETITVNRRPTLASTFSYPKFKIPPAFAAGSATMPAPAAAGDLSPSQLFPESF